MNILIVQQREWANKFGIPFAKYIKSKYPKAKFGAWVYKISTWDNIVNDKFHYDYKWLGYKYDDNALNPEIMNKYSDIKISDIEDYLGIDSVWRDLIHVDRSLIYHPGKKYRYSMSKQVSDETMLNLVRLNYGMIRDEIFGKFNPDIIFLPNFGSLFHNILYHFAKKNEVDCWRPIATKISGGITLTNEIKYKLSHVTKEFNNKLDIDDELYDNARDYVKNFRLKYIAPESFESREHPFDNLYKKLLEDFIRLPFRAVRHLINNRNKLNPQIYRTIDNIKVKNFIFGFFAKYKNLFGVKAFNYSHLDKDSEFIYFPLHVQPEVSTNLWAPYSTNQIETIRQVAIGLPGKYTLVVKEHPVMLGQRSKSYYQKIIGLPNVKLVSPTYNTYDLITNPMCKAVVCISGTTGFENMLLKKPTILLSDMFYSELPHCFRVTDLSTIPDTIRLIESIDLDKKDCEYKLIKLVSLLQKNSIHFKYGAMWILDHNVKTTPLLELMESKVKALIKKNGVN
jgi:hypothetical protein